MARSCAAGRLPLLALAVVLAALGAGAGLLLAQPGDEGPTPTTAAQPGQASPPGLRSRLAALRERLAARGGGTARSEAAVAAGLDWLARHQAADGHWSLDGFAEAGHCDCTGPGGKEDVAATAFGLLPFLGAGITHRSADQPRYAGVIEAGLAYLRRKQTSEGEFRNTRSGAMDTLYSHALATMAVCEAYGLTGDPALREPARRALDLIVRAQDPRLGGWRYRPGNGGDTSVTGWQVQALRRGDLAGLRVPKETLDGAIHWLDSCESPDGGYGYTGPRSTPTTTAVGLLCRQYLGWGKRGPTLRQGLMQLEPAPGGKSDLYYEYYATQVLANVGGPAWQKWNARVRDQLVSTQDRGEDPNHRHAKGSWFPAGDKYANAGGRLMLTALALRTLEVYYDTDLLLASRPPRALKADDLRGLWADLGSEDVPRARPALWALVAAPELALPFLKDHVPPADVAVDRQRLERAAAALDDDRFAVRKQAMADLEKAGDLAEPVLRKLLEGKPSVEARRRAEELLDQLAGKEYTPERRRARLAVEVLELTDTAQARELLEALARGTPEARLTREAKAALGRLGGKP